MANSPQAPIPETWLNSNRLVPTRFVRPVLEFTRVQAAGGVVLLIAAVIAVIWANSPWYHSYEELFHAHLDIDFWFFHLHLSLQHFINDGLMAIFFFVVASRSSGSWRSAN